MSSVPTNDVGGEPYDPWKLADGPYELEASDGTTPAPPRFPAAGVLGVVGVLGVLGSDEGSGDQANEDDDDPGYVNLGDVVSRRVDWLWDGYIPRGSLTLLSGDPSVGKTTLLLDLIARVSTGGDMPDGSPGILGDVLIIAGEDGYEDTLVPRLDAMGAALERIHGRTSYRQQEKEGGPWHDKYIALPTLTPRITDEVARRGIKLVVIDPLTSFIEKGLSTYTDADMRTALKPLAATAKRFNIAVVIIRHLNKGSSSNAMYGGAGSIGITAIARAEYQARVDPDDPSRSIFVPVKNNLAPYPPSLAYRIVMAEVKGGGDGEANNGEVITTSRIEWLGVSEHTADSIATAAAARITDPGSASKKEEATEAIFEVLREAGEPVAANDLEERVKVQGHSTSTFNRARTTLCKAKRITKAKDGRGGWWYGLPEQEGQEHQEHQGRQGGLPGVG